MVFSRSFALLAALIPAFTFHGVMGAEAAPGVESNSEYLLKFWRTEDGLPQNSITAITQTSDGYIWFGTRNGLVRFDGVRFRVFNAVNTPELRSSHITALNADGMGRLWMGLGDGGLAVNEEGGIRRLPSLESGPIHCLLATEEKLWVGTERGLFVWKEGSETGPGAVGDPIGETAVRALAKGPGGILWVGTAAGLFNSVENEFQAIAPRDRAISSIVAGLDGTVWIGGGSFGLLELRSQDKAPRRVWPVNEFSALCRSRSGGLWVVKPGGSLAKLSLQTLSTAPLPVRVENVTELFEDREGNLWVGTEGAGLAQLRRKRLVLHETGGASGGVMAVSEGAKGVLWLAGQSGQVFRLGEEGLQPFVEADAVTGGFCETLWASRGGGVWFGTRLNGLFYWDGKGPVELRQISGAAGIRALYEDRQGRMWIGSDEQGVLLWDEGKIRQVKGPEGSAFREVTCFTEDLEGRIWIGTRSGLAEWSEQSVRSYSGAAGLAGASIQCLYSDLEGNLWFGTTRGLGLRRNERFHAVTSRDGLYDDVVHQILEDFRGQLWLGSNRGIFRVAKDDLQEYFAGRMTSIQCLPYGMDEGVASPEGVGGRQPSAWRGSDGKLWFATGQGLAALDAVKRAAKGPPPPVIIEQVMVDNGTVEATGKGAVVIPAGYGRLHLQFTALSFIAPERTHFRYRLAGFEEEWKQAGVARLATYSQVPAGDYEFEVRGRNEDGGWQDSGAAVALTIAPHYWETAWFRALAGLVLASGAGFVWLAHSAKAREVKTLRQQITRDLHDDMGSNLGSIALLSEALQKRSCTDARWMAETASEINRIARATLESMGEAVWFVDPEKDSSVDLAAHLRQIAGTMLREVPHRFMAPEEPDQFRLPVDKKRAVVLVFKEALHNVIRHSGATEVGITVALERGTVTLTIRDNGKGFDLSQLGGGHGLSNIRHRAQKMGAMLRINSAPGNGTELSLSLNCY